MDWKWLQEKLEKIDSRTDQQAVTLARLTATVEEHVRRTNLLEQKLEPIDKHVTMVQGVGKSLLFLAGTAGVLKVLLGSFLT
jgi:hypothetical protein